MKQEVLHVFQMHTVVVPWALLYVVVIYDHVSYLETMYL
jgi:hypothetical protein